MRTRVLWDRRRLKILKIETLKAAVNTANKKVSLMDSLEEEVAHFRDECSKVQSMLETMEGKVKMMN